MTRQITMLRPPIGQKPIDAGIRRARRLRSQYLAGALIRVAEAVSQWFRRGAQQRHLENLPDYLLKDIGIRRDQIGATVSGILRRDPLALSPAGSQSSPAFKEVKAGAAENTDSEPERLLAA